MVAQYVLGWFQRMGASVFAVGNGRYSIGIVLCFAAFLRVGALHTIFYGFTGELYRDLLVVHHFISYGHWPLIGPMGSVGGYYFGPVYYYILAPFVWLMHFNPVGAVLASGVCSVATIYLVYRIVYVWTGMRHVALLAACLLSISVRDIQNAYYVSNPNFLPFFTALFLYAITRVSLQPQRVRWWLVAGVAFGIATQLHSVALAVLFLVGVAATGAYALYKYVWNITYAVCALFLTYVPYGYYEYAHGFANLRRLLHVGEHSFSLVPRLQSLTALIEFWVSTFFVKNDLFTFFVTHTGVYAVCLGIATGIALVVYYSAKKVRTPAVLNAHGFFFAAVWLLASLAVFIWYQSPIQFFYLLVLWPLPVIVLACVIVRLYEAKRGVAYVLVLMYCCAQIVQLVYMYPQLHAAAYEHGRLLRVFKGIDADAQGQSYIVMGVDADVNMLRYYTELAQSKPYQPVAAAHTIYSVRLSAGEAPSAPSANSYNLENTFTIDSVYVERYIRKHN